MSFSPYIWPPFSSLQPHWPTFKVRQAKKEYLYLEDGTQLLDMISSWWVNLHGHAHPKIVRAIQKQAKQLEHVIFSGFSHEPAEQLAQKLIQKTSPRFTKVFFSDDGSTSVEVALKLAAQYKGLSSSQEIRFLAFEGAYHGDTLGAMSVAERGLFNRAFASLLFPVDFIPYPIEGEAEKAQETLKALCQKRTYTALIYEPLVQGAGGMRMATPAALELVLQEAKKQGLLLVADEVMTGFFRTGTFLASDQMQTQPDLLCLSKGITGGFLPLAVTLVAPNIVQAFLKSNSVFYHGHSYTANPIACQAALASWEILEEKKTLQNILQLKKHFQEAKKNLQDIPSIKRVQCTGTILAVEIQATDEGYDSSLRDQIYFYFLKQGILARPLGNVLYYMPPYCISTKNLTFALQTMRDFLQSL